MAKEQRQVKSILIIEPMMRIRSGLEVSLKQAGYRVVAESGAEGLGHLETLYPDVLVLSCDIAFKGMTGFEICESIARSGLVAAIVMSSAKPTKELVLKSVRAGAQNFLVTPAQGLRLRQRIEKVFAQTEDAETRSKFPIIDFGERELTNAQKIKVIIKEAATVRAMPYAVSRILRITSSEQGGAKDITKAAESDPCIAAIIMKRANSSYYSGGNRVGDLQTAIVRLGFKECRDLAVGLTVFNLFAQDEKSFGFNRIWYWLHSMSCAVLANLLATRAALPAKQEAFTAGLLHDIGKIILDDFLNKPYGEVVRHAHTKKIPLISSELELLENSHVVVGTEIIKNWKFQDSTVEAIADHHDLEKVVQCKRPNLSASVYLANQMAKAMMVGGGGDFLIDDVPDAFCRMFNFNEAIPANFIEQFYSELQEFCSFLQINDQDLETALEHHADSGRLGILASDGQNTWLLSLLLLNQGFELQQYGSVESLRDAPDRPRVLVIVHDDVDEAGKTLTQLEEAELTAIPTLCILPKSVNATELWKQRQWLMTVKRPVDCFDVLCKLREFLPDLVKRETDSSAPAPVQA